MSWDEFSIRTSYLSRKQFVNMINKWEIHKKIHGNQDLEFHHTESKCSEDSKSQTYSSDYSPSE